MKKTNSGEVRLAQNERRIGNYFIKDYEKSISLSDLGGVMMFRVSKSMPIGIWLHNLYERNDEAAIGSIHAYVATFWSVLSVVPDDQYLQVLLGGAKDCLERHKDWYGIKDADDSEDAHVIEEERELAEFVEKVKEVPDAEVSDGEQA